MKINEKYNDLVNLNNEDGLKVTMTLPTHRTAPDNKSDPIVFKNLMKQAEEKLLEKIPNSGAKPYLEQLDAISMDHELFNNCLDSMVVFVSKQNALTLCLSTPLKESVIVSETLNLMPYFEYEDKYQKVYGLDLRKDSFTFYELDRYGQSQKDVDIISEFSELYDDFDNDSNLNFSSQGTFHGHRSSGEEVDNDKVKYFRYLNREFNEYLRHHPLPLVVFGTTENIALFEKMSDLEFEKADKPFKDYDSDELKEIVEKGLDTINSEVRENFETKLAYATRDDKVNHDPESIKEDLQQGRIDTLVIKDMNQVEFNEIMMQALENKVVVHFLDSIEHPILAIRRY